MEQLEEKLDFVERVACQAAADNLANIRCLLIKLIKQYIQFGCLVKRLR